MTPFFTIIIPCLNEERALPHLLTDLTRQTYKDFEVIVVDGHSEDKTQEKVKELRKLDKRFTVVTSEKRNVGHQRNLGAKQAQGEYLVFFDADNRLPPFYLAGLHYHCAKTKPDAFTTYIETDSTNAQDKLFVRMMNSIFEQASKMGKPFAFGACIVCKRTIFTKAKGFDESITYLEDSEFVRRLVRSGYSFFVFREPSFIYSLRRFHKEGTVRLYRKLAPLALKLLFTQRITEPIEAYPMLGGSYFEDTAKKKRRSRSRLQLEELTSMLRVILGFEKKS